ncbi:MAG: type II toxin-antitoxin system PemK/MazF family toxin [Candidatus Micrarchaeota archaeon]|nr:type II toxin-antitoxin system PemK/MazF family toxin [Candidatus Micrarchaeota archaeon]
MFEQGDVVLIPFPYSDLTGAKQRPALIISNQKIDRTEDRICCLITSNAPKEGIQISNSAYARDKLPFKSWVKPHRIFTVSEKIIKKRLCTTTRAFHEKVVAELVTGLTGQHAATLI